VSEAVVDAGAETTGIDPIATGPPYRVVDPDAPDGPIRATPDGARGASASVSLASKGRDVSVYGNRDVVVTPPNATKPSRPAAE